MDIKTLQKTMMEFERQNMQMDMTEEIMNDTIDGIMDEYVCFSVFSSFVL